MFLCTKLQTQAMYVCIYIACTCRTCTFPFLHPEDECYRFLQTARYNLCYQTTPRQMSIDSNLEILQCQYKQAYKDISPTLSTGVVGLCRRLGGGLSFPTLYKDMSCVPHSSLYCVYWKPPERKAMQR